MIYDFIIIGSGISGLNLAYQLIKNNNKNKILILEKNNYLGGRILTSNKKINGINYKYEKGAGRFNEKHILLKKLLIELNLKKYIIEIGSNIEFYPSTKYNNKYIHESPFKYIKIVIEKSKLDSKETLQKYTFIDYTKKYLNNDDIKFILDSFGYYAQLVKMNAYDAIKLFNEGMNPELKFYALKCGMSKIIENLNNKIKNKCDILLNEDVQEINFNDKIFTIKTDNKEFKSINCIAAIPKPDLLKLNFLNKYKSYLNSVYVKTLCRIYSVFLKKDIWFNDIGKTTTNNDSRYIIPINKENGLIMISYSDSKYADKWNKLNKNEMNTKLKNNIFKTFNKKISDPIFTEKCYWTVGTGFWKKNKDSEYLSEKILQLNKNIPFYICGENYSNTQCWIEGALESSNKILEKIIKNEKK